MGNQSIGAEDRKRVEALAEGLQAAFGDGLVAVLLYGSAARGDHFGRGGSDLNVAVVLNDMSLGTLERGTAAARSWIEDGNRPLLFLTRDWIGRSRDVFPMEFLDMVESHEVIWGSDPLAGLTVSHDNLRLQCESELKIKLIHLRTHYVQAHPSEEELARVMASSYAPLLAVCRGVLRLAGRRAPARGDEVVNEIAALFGIDAATLAEVAAIKRGGPSASAIAMKPLFRRYYTQIETLARAVDAGFQTGASR